MAIVDRTRAGPREATRECDRALRGHGFGRHNRAVTNENRERTHEMRGATSSTRLRRSRALAAAAISAPLVLATAACSTTSSTQQAVEQHANTFTFDNTSGSGSMISPTETPVGPALAFTFSGQYSITSGQPWGGVIGCSAPVNNCTITVNAGRSTSTEVAQWFAQNAPIAVCTSECGGGGMPNELNFAIAGTISTGTATYPITIGQGSNGAGLNNWWLGGTADQGWGGCTVNNVGPGICIGNIGFPGNAQQNADSAIFVVSQT